MSESISYGPMRNYLVEPFAEASIAALATKINTFLGTGKEKTLVAIVFPMPSSAGGSDGGGPFSAYQTAGFEGAAAADVSGDINAFFLAHPTFTLIKIEWASAGGASGTTTFDGGDPGDPSATPPIPATPASFSSTTTAVFRYSALVTYSEPAVSDDPPPVPTGPVTAFVIYTR